MLTVVRNKGTYRRGHRFDNKMLTAMIKILFSKNCNDVNSGYRVFSNRFVKSFPAHSSDFEIETELSVFALEMRLTISEMEAEYKSRPEGSFSKLNTFRDGFRILGLIIYLVMSERPLLFWWTISLFFALFGFYFGIPIVINFMKSGFVPVATAVLTICFMLLSGISVITGLIMNAVQRAIAEIRLYQYMNNKSINISV